MSHGIGIAHHLAIFPCGLLFELLFWFQTRTGEIVVYNKVGEVTAQAVQRGSGAHPCRYPRSGDGL